MMKGMELDNELICSLIIEDLDQTITPANKELLDSWRNQTEANEKTFQEYVSVQVNLDKIGSKYPYDTQSSWESLDEKLDLSPVVIEPHKHMFRWYKIAAAILIVLSAGYFMANNNRYVEINTGKDTIKAFTLPDGTRVNMNSATTIRYDKNNFAKNRKLQLLKGEVFIHVIQHNASQFTVDMGKVDAKDIGTSFNVLRDKEKVSIIVEDGAVALRHITSNQEVLLKRGQLGLYDVKTGLLKSTGNSDINYKAWIDKKFVFNEVPLAAVAGQLQKVYQNAIVINGNELQYRKITASLHYQTLDSALAVISASLQCKVTKDKDTYVLSAR
jgi:transmembrane sensor